MKKRIIFTLIALLTLTVTGCSNEKSIVDNKSNNTSSSIAKEEFLAAGSIFTVEDTNGAYEIKVNEAKYLGIHPGDEQKNQRLQITWELNNISFNGEITINDEIKKNIVAIDAMDLKVIDDKGYVLDEMSTGWDGDFVNDYKPVGIGEKMIKKATWILNDENSEFVTVSFDRMQNSKFKIEIK